MYRSDEIKEKILGGETLGKRETMVLFFETIQENSEFHELPILWKAEVGGPRFEVKGAMWGMVHVSVNVRGIGIADLIPFVQRAMKAGNDLYRGTTRVRMIANEPREPTLGRMEYVEAVVVDPKVARRERIKNLIY